MIKLLLDIFRLLRPRQWIKNFAIFAATLFSGQLLDFNVLLQVFYGFLIFCAISSAIYIINDLFDVEKDKLHPFKKYRPLAHGDVPVYLAAAISAVLALGSVILSYFISPTFFVITIVYLLMQFGYSALFKQIVIIDILTLATGYILRVFAGEVVSSYHISAWLFLTVISLSLFLAIGKRRSELTLLSHHSSSAVIMSTRKTLSQYSEKLLDVYLSIFATSTFISYALFTFMENPRGLQFTTDLIPADILGTYLQRKWLMITIIPVVYGLMRYLQRIYSKDEGESPERVLFSDRPLLAAVIVWTILVIILIYFIG